MKKRILSVALMAAMLLGVAACNGDTETSESATEGVIVTTTAGEEGETKETTTTAGAEKTEAKSSPVDGWNTGFPLDLEKFPLLESEEVFMEVFEFPSESIGGYSDGEYYSKEYVVVEKDKIIAYNNGKKAVFDFSEHVVKYHGKYDSDFDKNGDIVDSSGEKVGRVSGMLIFLDNINLKVVSSGDFIQISGSEYKRADVINNMPMVDYISLDAQGEFGVMNVPDEIKSVIENEAGDDYIIGNNSESDFYLLSCFDEDEILYKQIKFTNNGNGYTREDIDFQDPYEHYGVYIEQTGEKYQIASKLACISSMALSKFEETVIGGYTAPSSLVYGEHCFKSRVKDNVIFYMSKPISIAEGERFNELNPLIEGIFDFINVQINERGKEQYPDVALIIIADDMGDMKPNALASQISCEVRMDENTWYSIGNDGYPCSNVMEIFSDGNTLAISTDKPIKYVNNRWHLINGFSVVEATVNGDKFTVTFKYYSDNNVNSKNYKNYSPDETVTSEYTR